jgi:hypothetical protein
VGASRAGLCRSRSGGAGRGVIAAAAAAVVMLPGGAGSVAATTRACVRSCVCYCVRVRAGAPCPHIACVCAEPAPPLRAEPARRGSAGRV